MHLPCIKFISFTISYIIFLVLIIATSLRLDYDFSTFIQFSKVYPDRVLNYTNYIKNEDLAQAITSSWSLTISSVILITG